mmetsp:Transcript_25037/g.78452  ORF Transcript_25037/g.78452 Transcript_25037/m.78452 type:complete len:349 (+) Transcript_25037:275-1321(+)
MVAWRAFGSSNEGCRRCVGLCTGGALSEGWRSAKGDTVGGGGLGLRSTGERGGCMPLLRFVIGLMLGLCSGMELGLRLRQGIGLGLGLGTGLGLGPRLLKVFEAKCAPKSCGVGSLARSLSSKLPDWKASLKSRGAAESFRLGLGLLGIAVAFAIGLCFVLGWPARVGLSTGLRNTGKGLVEISDAGVVCAEKWSTSGIDGRCSPVAAALSSSWMEPTSFAPLGPRPKALAGIPLCTLWKAPSASFFFPRLARLRRRCSTFPTSSCRTCPLRMTLTLVETRRPLLRWLRRPLSAAWVSRMRLTQSSFSTAESALQAKLFSSLRITNSSRASERSTTMISSSGRARLSL